MQTETLINMLNVVLNSSFIKNSCILNHAIPYNSTYGNQQKLILQFLYIFHSLQQSFEQRKKDNTITNECTEAANNLLDCINTTLILEHLKAIHTLQSKKDKERDQHSLWDRLIRYIGGSDSDECTSDVRYTKPFKLTTIRCLEAYIQKLNSAEFVFAHALFSLIYIKTIQKLYPYNKYIYSSIEQYLLNNDISTPTNQNLNNLLSNLMNELKAKNDSRFFQSQTSTPQSTPPGIRHST